MFYPASRVTLLPRSPEAIWQKPDLLPKRFMEAIARHGHDAMQQLLTDRDIPPKMLLNVLAYACEKNCSSAIKNGLINHPAFGAQHEAALDLAVKYNDPDLAKQLRDLLTYARRKHTLYPASASTNKDTPLDRALREGRRDDAKALLKDGMQDKTVRQTWRSAVRDNQPDILRALLLLGHADQDRGFQLLQKGTIQDVGIAAVMKELPYFSPKRGLPPHLNGKATFTDTEEKILCRHLVTHQQEVQASDPEIKFDYRQFQDPATIAAQVKPNTETKYLALRAQATETHLIANQHFGRFLVAQFEAMAAENKDKATRQILVLSTNHAMNLSLRIKNKHGMKSYVARFFDPNRTTGSVRSKAGNLKTMETQELGSYLDGHHLLKEYYPESNAASMMYIRPPVQERQARSLLVVDNRVLASCIKDSEINAATMLHLLEGGFAGELRRLRDEIARRPEAAERIELLDTKTADGTPGLFVALQDGHADTIKAYGELLQHVPEKDRARLLAAKRADGIPGLAMALYRGHADAVEAYGEALQQVPKKDRAGLLAAKNADGTPGLFMALLAGNADAIKAYGKLLQYVPEEDHAELLAAKTADGIPGLHMALQNGHADAIKAYEELLQQAREKDRAKLLAVNKTNGIPKLSMALLTGDVDAIKGYRARLRHVPEKDRVALLAAKTADGTPGLFLALQNGHADAVNAYGELLQQVPKNERAGLLAAKRADGTSGLAVALQEGHADAVKAYGELLQHVPEEDRVELLAAKTVEGVSGLSSALQKGLLETVGQYIEVVMAIGLTRDARAALLKYIRESHATYHNKLGRWINREFYNRLKKEHPEFYARFKAMKDTLKT